MFDNAQIIRYQEQNMNLIDRIHGNAESNSHTHDDSTHSHKAPFWVRHYDTIVNVITLGKIKSTHQQTAVLANLQPGQSVLDIGCGTGALLMEVEIHIGDQGTAVGLDVEPAMIAQARQRAAKKHSHATFDVASIDNIPYPDNTFDVALQSLVFHHLTNAQKEAGLLELKRVLKPNGRLLIADLNPSKRGIATSLPGHNQLDQVDHVRSEVVERLKTAGFSNIQSDSHPNKQLSYAIGEK
jgi:ubiquinone/menaquinone biosynthesis C-methylase UbiE